MTQTAINLTQGGVTTPDEAKQLLRLPDTDRFLSQATAPIRLCQKLVNNILVHGKMHRPEKYMAPFADLLGKVALDAYLDASINDSTDPNNLELLRLFLDMLAETFGPGEPANDVGAPPQGAAPPGAPPPGGMPPPGPPGAPPGLPPPGAPPGQAA
jgi:hypothetical protein